MTDRRSFYGETLKNTLHQLARPFLMAANAVYFAGRFAKHSSAVHGPQNKEQLKAHILMDFHKVEKGLSLPEPRPGFGQKDIHKLIANVLEYEAEYGADETSMEARSALLCYKCFNASHGVHVEQLDHFLEGSTKAQGGTDTCEKSDLFTTETTTGKSFLISRRSVRNYTGEMISRETLEEVYAIAQRAPSVCNRQSAGVHFANTRISIDAALKHQNGNRGFGNTLGALGIVTVDMGSFVNRGELFQGYVDGGIFAMSLLLAAHSQHLGGCMLNWSVPMTHDRRARKTIGIPDNELIITFIGFGVPADKLRVASSPRRAKFDRLQWLS